MISIAIWGADAQAFARRHRSARVAATFSRSLLLEAEGDFLSIGNASIGNGPLNAIVQDHDWARMGKPAAGADAHLAPGTIRVAGTALRTRGAKAWRPPPWPRPAARGQVALALEALARAARDAAPADGLARTALRLPIDPAAPLNRLAQPRLERVRGWVGARMRGPTCYPPPVDLLGLGPGLTPSGDDILCGVLLALNACGHGPVACELRAAILGAQAGQTGPLSSAFLRAAAEGKGAEPLHGAIGALLAGQIGAIAPSLARVGGMGHTSGWESLAGAVLVLQAYSTSKGQRARVAWSPNTR
jgi:hypothetical protein